MDATDRHMKIIYDRIDAGTRVTLDCDKCELNAATARLREERDQALQWAALWKRAALINRAGRYYLRWITHRRDMERRMAKYCPALRRALRIP